MMDCTIIYCTSNRENFEFEQRIKNNILKNCGSIPIISVSQKPINFGKNICVGEVGVSGFNFFRQVQIACEETKTQYVISTEADCLYPPDYFTIIPSMIEDVCWRNKNLYVMGQHRAYYWKKEEGATHAQITSKDLYLKRLTELFKGAPKWSVEERNFPKERWHKEDIFDKHIQFYETVNPVVQIKTSHSMRHYTNSDRLRRDSILYWGDGVKFRRKYYDVGRRH